MGSTYAPAVRFFFPRAPQPCSADVSRSGAPEGGGRQRYAYVYHQNAIEALNDRAATMQSKNLHETPMSTVEEKAARLLKRNTARVKQGFSIDTRSYRHQYGMGHVRLARLRVQRFMRLIYNGIYWTLEKFQVDFAEACMKSLLRLIIGPEAWPIIGDAICRELNIVGILHTIVIATAMRRSGKTVASVVVMLALILVRPATVINIYSNAKRGAENIKSLMFKALSKTNAEGIIVGKARRAEIIGFYSLFENAAPSIIRFLPGDDRICTPSRALGAVRLCQR